MNTTSRIRGMISTWNSAPGGTVSTTGKLPRDKLILKAVKGAMASHPVAFMKVVSHTIREGGQGQDDLPLAMPLEMQLGEDTNEAEVTEGELIWMKRRPFIQTLGALVFHTDLMQHLLACVEQDVEGFGDTLVKFLQGLSCFYKVRAYER